MTATTPASGTQYELARGEYRAVIASIGASLRSLTFDGRDLVVPFDADQVRPNFRGATLAPWPNRIVDGQYDFAGEHRKLALTEPDRGHALHGLASWLDFAPDAASAPASASASAAAPAASAPASAGTRGVASYTGESVTLTAEIVPQIGYPHRVQLDVTYSLGENGLTQTVTATNVGRAAAPYGTSAHPYLVAGEGHVDDWTLELPASEVLLVTDDRLIPTGRADVADALDGSLDFRVPHLIGDTFIDHAYTGLAAGTQGSIVVRVTAADGTGVALEWSDPLPWVQVHTADRPSPEPSRIGLAVEPMTCPPDAFNSGEDLIVLEPGASHSASWTVEAIS